MGEGGQMGTRKFIMTTVSTVYWKVAKILKVLISHVHKDNGMTWQMYSLTSL